MEHFIQKDFADPDFPKLSEAIYYYKHTARGVEKMCAILDEYAKEYAQEYAEEYAKENEANMVRELFKNGVSFLSVKNSVKYLPEENC